MAMVKEGAVNDDEDVEVANGASVTVGKKPVHPILWNLMLIAG